MKLLLTSVFGPYAVDDEFGRKENVMELFHNQVTREQGIFSLRMNHESFGLHMIAENISIPTVVLDFPSQQRFITEIRKKYDYIGISSIVPNFIKVKRMVELIRQLSPESKIIVGGHVASIENIEKIIDCDYVCRGEGVRFMRELFNNDVNAPINHPMLYSSFNKHVMGAPVTRDGGSILPGVGCANSCRFCCTTHFFQKKYTSFLSTGKEIFDLCVKMEEKLGVREFFIMDENFLKSEDRARELVAEMEKHDKAYSFGIFSSAEAVTKVGLDFIQRLGVTFLWMGVESKKEVYEKNQNIDFKTLIKNLRGNGVSVLASGILFLEHHTKETIHEDIDFMTDLKADLVQFMQLGPLPGTKLFKDYEKKQKMLKDIPYEEWHGQHQLWFRHPHFTGEESASYLKQAFIHEYRSNGPSILRLADTALRGVTATLNHSASFMKKRHEQRINRAMELYPLLDALCTHAPDDYSKHLALDVRRRYDEFFGSRPLTLKLKSAAVQVLTVAERIRSSMIYNNMRQPKTISTSYRMMLDKLHEASFTGRRIHSKKSNILSINMTFNYPQVHLKLSGILDAKNIKTMQSSIIKFLKKEEKSITLNLSRLQQIEEDALRTFFKKIEKHRHQLQFIYSKNIENTRKIIENLMQEFQKISFVAV